MTCHPRRPPPPRTFHPSALCATRTCAAWGTRSYPTNFTNEVFPGDTGAGIDTVRSASAWPPLFAPPASCASCPVFAIQPCVCTGGSLEGGQFCTPVEYLRNFTMLFLGRCSYSASQRAATSPSETMYAPKTPRRRRGARKLLLAESLRAPSHRLVRGWAETVRGWAGGLGLSS